MAKRALERAAAPRKKAYRPVRRIHYSDELAAEICRQLARGHSLRQIGKMPGMPAKDTVLDWLAIHDDFAGQYARARERQMEEYAEQILEIADDTSRDCKVDDAGNTIFDHEHIQRSKLRVDARKWLMARLAPRKYSERIVNENVNSNINLGVDADLQMMTRDERREEAVRLARELGILDGPKIER